MKYFEVNFDSIVCPTHNYGGFSKGNIAAMEHKGMVSHPKLAALQGLKKMKLLHDLGVPQAVFPPFLRPSLETLRNFGFQGSDEEVIKNASTHAPLLLRACSDASAMWAANSSTVTPSIDTRDKKLHFTIANLLTQFHRSIESSEWLALFKKIFASEKFVIHSPLHKGGKMGDEGAANHTRFCKEQSGKGVHLFVYTHHAFEEETSGKFPRRQSFEACEAIVRRHGLDPSQVVFAKQNPALIDEGVFHNDVIATGHENFFFLHEKAFENCEEVVKEIDRKLRMISSTPLETYIVTEKELSIKQAVQSYLFNSQIVTVNGKRILIAPLECKELKLALPFEEIIYVDLKESMQNGGGPACVRLRVVMTEEEMAAIPSSYLFDEALYKSLSDWVERHFRDSLYQEDLKDIALYYESRNAIDSLNEIFFVTP